MAGIVINTTQKKTTEDPKNGLETIIGFLNKDIKIFGNQLKDKKKHTFYTDLHVLLSSGIDIKTSLDIVSADAVKKDERKLFETIKKEIIDGAGLSEAMQNSGRFSNYEVFSVKIGEESGQLSEVINNLCEFYSKKIEQKRKMVNAFSYPIIVLTTAIAAIAFMLNYIVPMFEDVFKRFNNKELPGITQAIINLSAFFSANFVTGLVLILAIVILIFSVRKKKWYRNYATRITLHIPVFGEVIRKVYLARFCMSMELLMSAKVPLINAIRLLKKMIGFYPIELSLDKIDCDLLNGKSLHESMTNFKVYDKRMVSLIKVAEEVNRLDEVFGKLKKQYNDDVDYKTNTIGSVLEPFIIIFIGIFVGIVLVAMYLPMFQLSTTIAD
jgi:type IV pilus assembly protein PilC